jgi:hypothetical protein
MHFYLVCLWSAQQTAENGVSGIFVAMCWIFVSKVSGLRPVASSALYLLLYGRKIMFMNVGITTPMSWFEVHMELMSLLLAIILPLGMVKS